MLTVPLLITGSREPHTGRDMRLRKTQETSAAAFSQSFPPTRQASPSLVCSPPPQSCLQNTGFIPITGLLHKPPWLPTTLNIKCTCTLLPSTTWPQPAFLENLSR